MIGFLALVLFVIVTSSALILLKMGTKNGALISIKNKRPRLHITKQSFFGILLYGISFLLYMYLIAQNDLGYIIPLTTALVYLILFPASYYLFREKFTRLKLLGIGCIAIGLILLNLP